MSRKVVIRVVVTLHATIDEGQSVSDFVDSLDYSFSDGTGKATIEDTEIVTHDVVDSR